jgi:hypothetical protein
MEKRVDGVKTAEGVAESDNDKEPSAVVIGLIGLERKIMLDIAAGASAAAMVG